MSDQPPGYPPPSGYGYGYPPPEPPGYGPGYGYPPSMGYPAQQSTNGMAIAALVSALVGLFCTVGSVLGIVFGFISLHQIKTTGQQGRGMALAGIIVGALTAVAGVIIVIAMIMLAATERQHRQRDYDDYDYSTSPASVLIVAPQSPEALKVAAA